MIQSKLQRRLSSTALESEPGTPDQNADATRFDESLKVLAGVGARRDLVGSLGVAGMALLTALGLGEATAAQSKNKSGPGKKNAKSQGKSTGDETSTNQTDTEPQASTEAKKTKNKKKYPNDIPSDLGKALSRTDRSYWPAGTRGTGWRG